MARVKRGVPAHRRHKRLLKQASGRRGTRSTLIRPAREALNKFAKFASIRLANTDEVTADTLSLIRKFDKRVCPLSCRANEKAEGDSCVRIVCPAGQVMQPSFSGEPITQPMLKLEMAQEVGQGA